jgi:hypothetical protein
MNAMAFDYSSQTRVHFFSYDKSRSDPYSVAAKKIENSSDPKLNCIQQCFSVLYQRTEKGQTDWYKLNISSIEKRFHISWSELQPLIDNNGVLDTKTFETLIQSKYDKVTTINQMFHGDYNLKQKFISALVKNKAMPKHQKVLFWNPNENIYLFSVEGSFSHLKNQVFQKSKGEVLLVVFEGRNMQDRSNPFAQLKKDLSFIKENDVREKLEAADSPFEIQFIGKSEYNLIMRTSELSTALFKKVAKEDSQGKDVGFSFKFSLPCFVRNLMRIYSVAVNLFFSLTRR